MSVEQIFQLLGIIYVVAGVGILLNPKHYKKMIDDVVRNSGVMLLNAFIALTMGYLLLVVNSEWQAEAPVIITIFGWLALIKGVVILVFPQVYVKMANMVKLKYLKTEAWIALIVGAILLYLGFLA